jgi:hypothetical protein
MGGTPFSLGCKKKRKKTFDFSKKKEENSRYKCYKYHLNDPGKGFTILTLS